MDGVHGLGWTDAVRRQRRQAIGERVAALYRQAAAAFQARDPFVAEAALVEARDLTEELEATADVQTWLRWVNADGRRASVTLRGD